VGERGKALTFVSSAPPGKKYRGKTEPHSPRHATPGKIDPVLYVRKLHSSRRMQIGPQANSSPERGSLPAKALNHRNGEKGLLRGGRVKDWVFENGRRGLGRR